MASNTPNLVLGYIEEGQVRGEITHNEALNVLDALVHIHCLEIQATPPLTPVNGDRYIVAASGATGAWTGKENKIACYYSGWVFVTPKKGFFVHVKNGVLNGFFFYDGTAWGNAGTIVNLTGGISATYVQAEVLAIYNKVNSLLDGLRTIGILRA